MFERAKINSQGYVDGALGLVIEILSRSTAKRDRGYKKDAYERYGVKEYWIVHPTEFSIEVYTLIDSKYSFDMFYILEKRMLDYMTQEEKDEIEYTFSPSMFPDLIIDIREVFTNYKEEEF